MDDDRGKGPRGHDPEGEARCQHYTYAHRALPGYVFESPRRFFSVMSSERAMEFLTAIWEDAGEFSRAQGRGYNHSFDDARLHRVLLAERTFLTVIELPDAACVTEAVFVGFVLTLGPEAPDGNSPYTARYYTLERTDAHFVPSGVMFCEWTADRRHVNHGVAEDDTLRGFVERVRGIVVSARA